MNLHYGQENNYARVVRNQSLQRSQSFCENIKNLLQKLFSRPKKDKTGREGGGVREVVAKLSRGLMLPIAILPIAGILLGVGAAIETNTTGVGNNWNFCLSFQGMLSLVIYQFYSVLP